MVCKLPRMFAKKWVDQLFCKVPRVFANKRISQTNCNIYIIHIRVCKGAVWLLLLLLVVLLALVWADVSVGTGWRR